MSLLHIHGQSDQNVPVDGSPGQGPGQIDGLDIASTVDIWRTADRCPPPAVRTDGDVTTSSAACPDGRDVILVTIAGAGHQWPGSPARTVAQRVLGLDEPSAALDATAAIWQFFTEHSRE